MKWDILNPVSFDLESRLKSLLSVACRRQMTRFLFQMNYNLLNEQNQQLANGDYKLNF